MVPELTAMLLVLMLSSTVLLGTVLVITRRPGRLSAEERHLILTVSLLSLLVLPLAAYYLPKVRLSLNLPGLEAGLEAAAIVVSSKEGERSSPGRDRVARENASAESSAARASIEDASPGGASSERSAEAGPGMPGLDVRALIVGAYLGVTALLALVFAVGLVRLGHRVRKLPAVADAVTSGLMSEVARELGVPRPVRLRASDTEHTPWAWGVLRPTIVLPQQFGEWTEADRRNALVHELAHVRRLDALWLTLARFVAVLYWLQPLAWVAVRRMRREAEHACDDRVVLSGADESAYAAQLLGIARAVYSDAQARSYVPAMACTSLVSYRIHSILDPRMRRASVTRIKTHAAIALMLLLGAPLATLRGQDPNVPNSQDDLERVVENLIEVEQPGRAEDVIARWIAGDYEAAQAANGYCDVCVASLRDRARHGAARDARVVESSDAQFHASALESVDGYRYVPRVNGGAPARVPGVRTMIRYALE